MKIKIINFVFKLDLKVTMTFILSIIGYNIPLRYKNAGRFEKLLCSARGHSIVTGGSVSLSCAITPHRSCFSLLNLNVIA